MFGVRIVWRRVPSPAIDDVAAVSVLVGVIGGCVLLGLVAGAIEALGLFFALLVLWGAVTLRAHRPVEPDAAPEA